MTATSEAAPQTTSAATGFVELTVSKVDRLTDDSAAITFAVPDELHEQFAFRPGQSLTVKRGEERRSYSICAPAGAEPRIGVREVQGGHVSGWLVREVRPGDRVEVQAPTGRFTPDLDEPAHHVLIAAGSGITPMLSIAASALAAGSRVTLLYGNRRTNSVMFADELADLKDVHPAALHLVHVLSREPQEVELFSGRLDAEKLRQLLPVVTDVAGVDHWWLCGPYGMVTDAVDVLTELGVERARVHRAFRTDERDIARAPGCRAAQRQLFPQAVHAPLEHRTPGPVLLLVLRRLGERGALRRDRVLERHSPRRVGGRVLDRPIDIHGQRHVPAQLSLQFLQTRVAQH